MMEKKYQHMMEQVNMDEGFASGLLEQHPGGAAPNGGPGPCGRPSSRPVCVWRWWGRRWRPASDVIQQYFGTILLPSGRQHMMK